MRLALPAWSPMPILPMFWLRPPPRVAACPAPSGMPPHQANSRTPGPPRLPRRKSRWDAGPLAHLPGLLRHGVEPLEDLIAHDLGRQDPCRKAVFFAQVNNPAPPSPTDRKDRTVSRWYEPKCRWQGGILHANPASMAQDPAIPWAPIASKYCRRISLLGELPPPGRAHTI